MQEIIEFIKATVECSVYLEPTAPGLTYSEIMEACAQAGYLEGESGDAFERTGIDQYIGGAARLMPDESTQMFIGIFHLREDPDLRNFAALDFMVAELNNLARSVGASRAQVDRSILVQRAVTAGLPARDSEAAITVLVMSRQFSEQNGIISSSAAGSLGLPSASQRSYGSSPSIRKVARSRAYPIVSDVIARRSDGRPAKAEPLEAFADKLAPLGYGNFRLWWAQTLAELRRTDPSVSPLSTAVLAAALVEGALTFVVKHGRALNIGVFGSTDFKRSPRSWKIDDLVTSAAAGREGAILDEATKQRAAGLIRTRQRIHAGRMLEEFPAGVPDLRPEEARDALATAELVVRKVLDWLDRHPPT